MTAIEASKNQTKKEVSSNLQERRVRQKPRYKLGELVQTADIKSVFSKRDSTNWSQKLYTNN